MPMGALQYICNPALRCAHWLCSIRHYRFLARMLTRRAQLYTEMISDNAVIHGQVSARGCQRGGGMI